MAIAVAAILTSVYTLTGCQSHQGDEDQLENDIDSFATYYFNWQFPKTQKYCTQSSEPWLRYAASNVHQADVDLLRTKAEGCHDRNQRHRLQRRRSERHRQHHRI